MVWSESGPLTASACTAAAPWPPARTTLRRAGIFGAEPPGTAAPSAWAPACPTTAPAATIAPPCRPRPRAGNAAWSAWIVCRSSLAVPAGGTGGPSSSCPPVHECPDSTASAPNRQVGEHIGLITTRRRTGAPAGSTVSSLLPQRRSGAHAEASGARGARHDDPGESARGGRLLGG